MLSLQVGYIVMFDQSTGLRNGVLRIKKAKVAGVYHPLIDEKLVSILHRYEHQLLEVSVSVFQLVRISFNRRNKMIYAWTVDDPDSMQKMLDERVDAVITNNPTRLQQLMHDIRTQCLEEGFSLRR